MSSKATVFTSKMRGLVKQDSGESEALFYAKLDDLFDAAERKCIPKFTSFLDESRQFLAQKYLKANRRTGWMFWGGYEGAGRRMLGVFPDYMEPAPEQFPAASFTAFYRKADSLTHRDFLGSLMALGIKRDAVGDILPAEGYCLFFTTDKVEALVLDEIQKVGRTGVRVESGLHMALPEGEKFQEISGTVASLRLDCVVALLTGKSREKAGELIQGGLVAKNYLLCDSNSAAVNPGDILSVRGFGKARLAEEVRMTKKERCFITLMKYV